MGKTFRRNSEYGRCRTMEGTIAHVMEHMTRFNKWDEPSTVSVHETKAEFRKRRVEIQKQYDEDIAAWEEACAEVDRKRLAHAERHRIFHSDFGHPLFPYPRKPERWTYFRRQIVGSKPFDAHEYFDRLVEDWHEGEVVRDGKANYYSRGNRVYREMTNNLIRGSNRRNVHKVFTGSGEDVIWMTNADAKKFIWSVW